MLDALAPLDVPVIFDLELGHVPPHTPIVNGAQSMIFTIFEGTSEIQRMLIGRTVTGLDVP